MIRQIESFHTNLDIHVFAKLGVLHNRQIVIGQGWTVEHESILVPQGSQRLQAECRGIEVVIDVPGLNYSI